MPKERDVETFGEQLLARVRRQPGLSDRELSELLAGKGVHPSQVNQEARLLEQRGVLVRKKRRDGILGNYPSGAEVAGDAPEPDFRVVSTEECLSEDELKQVLARWLEEAGWTPQVAWGKTRGIDIDASRRDERWIIEVKGLGSLQPMRLNYFIAVLGETLQRMDDEDANYSIALPDIPQYRGLWERLPTLAKLRTRITALFVSSDGQVCEQA